MGLSFYKAAGRAHRIRGHITVSIVVCVFFFFFFFFFYSLFFLAAMTQYTLSPLVQNPMKNMFSIKYNIGRAKQKVILSFHFSFHFFLFIFFLVLFTNDNHFKFI